jgi:hypothetical protein
MGFAASKISFHPLRLKNFALQYVRITVRREDFQRRSGGDV